ncbi:Ras GTPase-activating protein raskol [Taenia solium]|eukprot:TsM_000232200 transcript=TsM_000232200 gene=TsM_000232200
MAPGVSTQKGQLSHFGRARDLNTFAASIRAVGSWCGHGEVEEIERNEQMADTFRFSSLVLWDRTREKCASSRSPELLTFTLNVVIFRLAGVNSLRRTAKPNLENERHRENSLFLSILEAKGLNNKRRYYCDICLDRTLYARTTSKQCLGNSIFWAEEFDLNNLPDVSILTMSLYREAEGGAKDGRKGLLVRSNSKKTSKKFQNRLIGFVTLPITKVCTRNPAQTWLTLQPPENADSMNPILLGPGEIGGSSSTISTNFISSASANNASGSTGVQLRVFVRYKSVDVLPISAYLPLHTPLLQLDISLNCSMSTAVCKSLLPHSRVCADDSPRTPFQLVLKNGLEFTEWFEHLIPLKLKEEVASCFVNLHERSGTAASFLTELVVREVSSLENDSMTFRSNTMATKAVESYIKLVGKEYLHNLLYRYIQRVLICPETWEVDPDKLVPSSLAPGTLLAPDGQGTSTSAALIIQEYCAKKRMPAGGYEQSTPGGGLSRLAVLNSGRVAQPGSLVFSQTQLLQHLDLVWDSICASLPDFPRPLLEVFSSFRAVLEPSKGAEFCDKLISACIFLRFVCPAILTPSLFGLASTFPGESNCQRNLTLVAKSLQSLANLSTFGDKESFMRFMNAYVEAQIPVMRSFLRDISSLPGVLEPRKRVASPVAGIIDCGYELACLQNICQELFSTHSGQQKLSNTSERAETALEMKDDIILGQNIYTHSQYTRAWGYRHGSEASPPGEGAMDKIQCSPSLKPRVKQAVNV